MNTTTRSTARRAVLAATMLLVAGTAPAAAQHLHTNDRWDECSFLLDPSLTQQAWHQFAEELGLVMYFRPMASARPIGKGHFDVAVLQANTRVDAADAAWNDTFSHPDSAHYLFEGDALPLPGLMLRAGVSDRADVGVYYTKGFRANYHIAGAQLQYNLLDNTTNKLAAATRVSVVHLIGPEDLDASVYGLDFVMSRSWSFVAPYAGVSGYLARAQEETSKVALRDENVLGMQATAGVAFEWSRVKISAEYNVGHVDNYSLKVGFGM